MAFKDVEAVDWLHCVKTDRRAGRSCFRQLVKSKSLFFRSAVRFLLGPNAKKLSVEP